MTALNTTSRGFGLTIVLALAPAGCGSAMDTATQEEGRQQEAPPAEQAKSPPIKGRQMDRGGRVAISTALIQPFNTDVSAKNQRRNDYNAAAVKDWPEFKEDIAASLGVLDALDAQCGNQLLATEEVDEHRYSALADVLVDDQLYVLSDRNECGVYLGAEAELVGAVGSGEGQCGGRIPSDDVIDLSYGVLAAGVLSGVTDGVDAPEAFPSQFPFLLDPVD